MGIVKDITGCDEVKDLLKRISWARCNTTSLGTQESQPFAIRVVSPLLDKGQ